MPSKNAFAVLLILLVFFVCIDRSSSKSVLNTNTNPHASASGPRVVCKDIFERYGNVCECSLASEEDMTAFESHASCSGFPSTKSLESNSDVVDVFTSYHKDDRNHFFNHSTQPMRQFSDDSAVDLIINLDTRYQNILGFGGAFTDAAAYNFQSLNSELQQDLLQALFHPETGLGYNMGRVNMGSCDFSQKYYTLSNVTNDYDMKHFCLRDDADDAVCGTDRKLEFVKQAQKVLGEEHLKLFLSPWTAPPWMKRNHTFVGSDLDFSNKRVLRAYALYFIKFISAYQQQGVEMFGLTIQNEPTVDPPWEKMRMTAEEQVEFLTHYLGPAIREAFPKIKIMIYDGQTSGLASYAKTVLSAGKQTNQYIDGIAYHWYESLASILENSTNINIGTRNIGGGKNVRLVHQLATANAVRDGLPVPFLLPTESCNGYFPFSLRELGISQGPSPGSWKNGFHYSRDMVYQLLNGAAGYVDWNLLLDYRGGPNHSHNLVDAALLLKPDRSGYLKQPMYYHIAHFARFITRGSQRVEVQLVNQPKSGKEIVAFVTPQNKLVLVLVNDSFLPFTAKSKRLTVRFERRVFTLELPSHSVQTAVIAL